MTWSWVKAEMTKKLCIVTGATAGIGYETALGLARWGAKVVLTGRDAARGEDALANIRQQIPGAEVDFLIADFASLQAVRGLAAAILDRHEKIDVLVNNAGGFHGKRSLTVDGFETTFAVNHLAPFLLTNLLLGKLIASAPARIVTVASVAHKKHGASLDDPQSKKHYGMWSAYANSKLANILFTSELAQRLAGTGVTANCLHPGLVASNIATHYTPLRLIWKLLTPFLLTPAEGARTSLYLATSPEVEGVTGKYFDKCRAVEPSPAARDMAAARELWDESARMVNLK
jgi:NAD(P)-dependent dehydrogenase (short-subunit alcohol dehydrogenase family)